MVNMHYNDFLK